MPSVSAFLQFYCFAVVFPALNINNCLHVSFPLTLGLGDVCPTSIFAWSEPSSKAFGMQTAAAVVVWFLALQSVYVYIHSVAPDYKGNMSIQAVCRRWIKV